VAVGRIDRVVALTGFSYMKIYGHFAETRKTGQNNEMTILRGDYVKHASSHSDICTARGDQCPLLSLV